MASRRTNGVAIREIRKALGISQVALAAAVGVDKSAMSRIEGQTQQPKPETLLKIAGRLGVPLDAITSSVPDPQPEEVAS
jgi:transcriptional regulator with XRE-family HTH domain